MARLKCRSNRCDDKATLFLKAWGQNGWEGFYCSKHAGRIIKLRSRLISKYHQSVMVRPVTTRDRMKAKVKK